MAKQQRRQQVVRTQQGQHGHMVEEVFDDNLLLDAAEIEKLYAIDPHILEWLKQSADKEQAFRHKAFETKTDLVRNNERSFRKVNTMGLVFSFILTLAAMAFSSWLIYCNHEVLGSIFGGSVILAIISAFLSKVIVPKQNNNNN
ncbi:hypothetical protein [uncultured Chryseobacterium sp.]|uniref:hypothetical protein n=1 Tax=uncultured Chryseobacterium sp. TaxID=259322 RepID=UPI0025EDA2FB|nr:hypothetical protein [uncultured Chryseobacterium sp.]